MTNVCQSQCIGTVVTALNRKVRVTAVLQLEDSEAGIKSRNYGIRAASESESTGQPGDFELRIITGKSSP